MKKTLLILAAGMGSRFGGGIKQLEPVGPNGEIIIDYSIHDAIKAGFNKIVFIIRKDIEEDFKNVIGYRTEKIASKFNVEINYVFQNMDNIPDKYKEGRTKPFGTAHAILCCKEVVDGPFSVINADDFYGSESFEKASAALEDDGYSLVSYILKNTLSENGGVSRGVCTVVNNFLTDIIETTNIEKTENGVITSNGYINPETLVSMNFWCLPCSFISFLEKRFPEFLCTLSNPLKDEFMLPSEVNLQIKAGKKVKIITTNEKWFGVTYKEDKPFVVDSFKKLYENGIYNNELYSDIK